jgi:hypothetical protein
VLVEIAPAGEERAPRDRLRAAASALGVPLGVGASGGAVCLGLLWLSGSALLAAGGTFAALAAAVIALDAWRRDGDCAARGRIATGRPTRWPGTLVLEPVPSGPAPFTCGRKGGETADTQRRGRSRVVAALLAFFLGGFGIHKFYLRQVRTEP